jgi:hypothetical protein
MKAMIGVSGRIHQRRGDVVRNVGFGTQAQNRTLWFSVNKSLALFGRSIIKSGAARP